MFYELAREFGLPLKDYDFYSCMANGTWDDLNDTLKNKLIKNGEQYLNFEYPPIPATLFMSFVRTGNRVNYENVYFARRIALNSLVLAECAEKKGRFTDDIINGIFALCEESAWQLPPHNSYIRDTPSLLLADSAAPVLDLFACETGAQLAMIRYLLKDSFDKISPVINKRIGYELEFRIITPYLKQHFWWMGKENEPMNNWTIWCTQNILITVFTGSQPDSVKSEVFFKASRSIDYFLKEYGEDGCCDEGAQYYRHAGLCLFNTMEILNAITKDYFLSLYQDNKIRNIAAYIENVHVDDKYYINFADCSPIAGRAGIREFLFGKRTDNPSLMSFAAEDFKKNPDPLLTGDINLFHRLQSLFHFHEINSFPSGELVMKKDLYYPSVGLFIARDERFCLAVKAGDNNDSHNHNDTGSFTVYKDSRPMFIDIGVESYTLKTFSPKRYEIWTMQSDYHNLPSINGLMQKNGAEYKATGIHTAFENNMASIEMDIASAYPDKGYVRHYRRSVILEKGKHITLTDEVIPGSGKADIILNLITCEKPFVHSNLGNIVDNSTNNVSKNAGNNADTVIHNTDCTIEIGSLGHVTLLGGISAVEIESFPITDPRLQTAWKHEIYRIRITLAGNKLVLRIT